MLNLPTFLFINGPAGSGKDTLAKLIAAEHPSAFIEGFAEPIRAMIYSVFFPNEGPIDYSIDLREQSVKASPIPFLGVRRDPFDAPQAEDATITIRQEMIAFSETYMKRRYGDQIFGKLLLVRCKEQMMFSHHFIISDSGFISEAQYIIDQVGAHNCILLRLHRDGCNYSSDSRGYISLPISSYDIDNNREPKAMLDQLQLVLGNL